MAIKITIHEICTKCGKVAAKQDSDGTVHFSHVCEKGAPGPPDYPRSFRPGQVIFVPASEPITDNELDEIKRWGELYILDSTKVRHVVAKIRELRSVVELLRKTEHDDIISLKANNIRLKSDLSEMAKDCAKLQKALLDIGFMVRDILGIEIEPKISPRAWQCTCDIWNFSSRKCCVNCGKKAKD